MVLRDLADWNGQKWQPIYTGCQNFFTVIANSVPSKSPTLDACPKTGEEFLSLLQDKARTQWTETDSCQSGAERNSVEGDADIHRNGTEEGQTVEENPDIRQTEEEESQPRKKDPETQNSQVDWQAL